MDTILQGLQSLEGALGAIVMDASGKIVGYRTHSVYDLTLLEQVCHTVATALDSVQLLHEDWDGITTTFSDGRLLIRNLASGNPRTGTPLRALVLIADGRLNPSFAGVALRVAVSKLKNLPNTPGATPPTPVQLSGSAITGSSATGFSSPQPAAAAAPKVEVAASGLSWSGIGGSSMAASGVNVTNAESAAYLTACVKAMAHGVGPMAKAFVKDAVRKLWPDRPFSREFGPALVAELENHIENQDDRARFRKAMKI